VAAGQAAESAEEEDASHRVAVPPGPPALRAIGPSNVLSDAPARTLRRSAPGVLHPRASTIAAGMEGQPMEWIRGAGEYGRLILAATAGVGIAALVAAWVRAPRRIAIGLLVLGLLPAALGAVGMIVTMAQTSAEIDTLRAPTPKDLAHDVYTRMCCMLLGTAGTALSLVAAAAAYARSPRPEEPPPVSS
jgi:hypothetical protein